jgi:transposase
MPKAHKSYVDWTPQRLIGWASHTGPQTAAMVETILASRCHPQQGFRSAMGLIRLGKIYGAERLEAACNVALAGEAMSYKSVKSILETGLDKQPQQAELIQAEPIKHNNIRGGNYYH